MKNKLYLIYNIVDNKTVRTNENLYRKFRRQNKYVLGTLVKTNRGFFIDGKHVDQAAFNTWQELNHNVDTAKAVYDTYNNYLSSLKNE